MNSSEIDDKMRSLIEGVFKSQDKKKIDMKPECDFCGTTLKEIESRELFGCPHCYDKFSFYIHQDKEKAERIFKRKSYSKEKSDLLINLKKELKKAVERENFEKAAKIRDQIRNFNSEGFLGDY
jgi:protein arginine kinase activator